MAIAPEPRVLDDAGLAVKPLRLTSLLRQMIAAINALGAGGSSLTIEEVDGAPTGVPTKLVLPNGTLTIVAGVATYTPSGGGAPSVNNQSAAYQFVVADYTGLVTVRHPPADVTARVWTIPSNATAANVVGVNIPLRVGAGAGAITLTPAGGVSLLAAGNSSSGSRVLAAGFVGNLQCEATDVWNLSGTGWT